jgi:acetyl-CoA C-acetyltransferase
MADRKKLDKKPRSRTSRVGCVTQVKEQGACIARVALIAAQWPEDVTGFTINRFCGSGLEAVNSIASKIGAGFIDAGVGGWRRVDVARADGQRGAMLDGLNEELRKRLYWCHRASRRSGSRRAKGFTRDDVDKFALASQQKAARAIEGKHFANAMFAVKNDDGSSRSTRTSIRARTPRSRPRRLQAGVREMGAMRWARTARRSTSSRSIAIPIRKRSSTCTPAVTRRASSTAPPSC